MDNEQQEMVDEMLKSIRENAMNNILDLLDEATGLAMLGRVEKVQVVTQKAIIQVEMVSDALANIIAKAYGGEKASIAKVENTQLLKQVRETFIDKIMLAIHIRNAMEKGIPEA